MIARAARLGTADVVSHVPLTSPLPLTSPVLHTSPVPLTSPVLHTSPSPETMLPTGSTTLLQKDRS